MTDPAPDTPDTPADLPVANAQAQPEATLKPEIGFDDFMKLDLRVATVVEAEAHPNADRLLKLQVDLGPTGGGRRQICAGIRGAYAPEDLVGKQIVVVANLAPRKIRGEVSNGMLLAASDAESDATVLVTAMAQVAAGSTVG